MKESLKDLLLEKLAALLEMRTGLAFAACLFFGYCVFHGTIGAEEVKNAFWMVLGWYSGVNAVTKKTSETRSLPSSSNE